MQPDPRDEQWVLPERRDGEPDEPVRATSGSSPDGPADTPVPPAASPGDDVGAGLPPPAEATPPRMPAPPQMPAGGPPPSAWGSTPAQPPAETPSAPAVAPRTLGSKAGPEAAHHEDREQPNGASPEGSLAEPAETASAAGADPAALPPQAAVAPAAQGDWLASVCPYLTSEDGTYRSAAPDEGHRCTAQDPAATLPLAFQERFCLTDRHPRCEMYKFAQETDASGAIPIAKVPPTDPPTPRVRSGSGGAGRPVWLAPVGIGVAVLLIVVLALIMGSCSGGGGTDVDSQASGEPQATERAEATPKPTAAPEPTPTPDPEATPDESANVAEVVILYEIQPGEGLRAVADTFGVSRNRIRRANPGLEDFTPAELPGQTIEIPLVGELTLEEVEALELDGYLGAAP